MKNYSNYLNVMLETAFAEFGSALEMLSACKNSNHENFCCGYFNHAKDEYEHAKTFLSILSSHGKEIPSSIARDYRFSSNSLISKGYVSKKGYLVETMQLKDFIAYVYTNELLAKKSFEGILKIVEKSSKESNQIRRIMDDELRHHGLAEKYFLKYYPRLQPLQLMLYRVRETLKNKGRKLYTKNLKLLDKILSPLYKLISYIAGLIVGLVKIKDFNRNGINLMDISSKSVM